MARVRLPRLCAIWQFFYAKWNSAAAAALLDFNSAMLMRNDQVCLIERTIASPPRVRRVLLLIDTCGAFGRGVLAGIAKYNREHRNWSIGLGDASQARQWL